MATTINNTTTGVTTTPDATGNLAIQTNGVTALTIDHNQIVTFANALTLTVDAAAVVTSAAQPAITSVGTLTGLTVTNPISGSVTGSAATVTTAAQPAITSVGTLTGLTMGGTLNLVANGLTTTPVAFTSGSLLTSPVTGAMEYDGTLFYATPVASSRNVLVEEQTMYLTSTLTLVSQTAAQPMFKGAAGSTNGALTLPAGNYAFECFYNLSAMAGSSGSFGFALAGTATFTQNWQTMGSKAANLVTAASPQVTYNTAANATIVTASTATAGWAKVTGAIRVSVGGTIIPSVSLGAAAAAVVGIGSYFRIRPTGAGSFVGNWS